MNAELLKQIDILIEQSRSDVIRDTISLVNINSEKGEAMPGAPFGRGPRMLLDKVIEMGKEESFYTCDYGVGVVSMAMKEGDADLGIWLHGDVVPAGDGWVFEPYNAVEYKGCVVGRGAGDNKGQLAAMLNLFIIFRKLGIDLKYNAAIFVGSNEETGMFDMKGMDKNPDARGFLNVCKSPKLSLVPDGGFPVGIGGKGTATFRIKSKAPLHGLTFEAGLDASPGKAEAVFENAQIPDTINGCTVEKNRVSAFTPPRHSAHPDANGNMITILSSALLENNLVCSSDRYVFEMFRDLSLDVKGKIFEDGNSSCFTDKLSLYAGSVTCNEGFAELEVRVRYPAGITFEMIFERLTEICEEKGFDVTGERRHEPYIRDENTEIINLLASAYNSVTGENSKPYIESGATYAHYLPNAYIFGTSANRPPEGFPEGHGSVHGIDECVSVDRLIIAMKAYARAILMLNETELI